MTVVSPPPAGSAEADDIRDHDRSGLDLEEAAARLAATGPNRIVAGARRSLLLRFLDQFRSALVLILLGAAVLAALVGDLKDPIVIGFVVLVNACIGLAQERKAERSLEALRSMLSPVARVRRSGVVREVDAETIVPGDIVVLEAGERVPADARLLVAVDLEVDESALTGESVPAVKSVEPVTAPDAPIGERTDRLFMHTVVTRGRAEALVAATGMQTEVGRLAALLREAPEDPTPLQRRLEHLGHRLAGIAGVAVAVMLLVGWMRGTPTDELIVSAVALAVAAIPEGLPAVVAVTLALGAHRMAGRRAIVKRLASVETLGSTTGICSDKTGTLTQNRMTAALWWCGSEVGTVPAGPPSDPALARLAEAMVLANDAEPPADGPAAGDGAIGDPTEVGLLGLAGTAEQVRAWRASGERVGEVPFDSAVRTMSVVWRDADGTARVIVKGALDAVLARCASGPDGEMLGARAIEAVRAVHDRLAADGHRVLAAATATGARDAIAACHRAGISVKMITGDHAVTARAIAADLGIRGDVVSGAELDDMTPDVLANRIDGIG
ncbi:MAG: cation-translocating P-type ATPase, partial [Actinomycetota bacterium]